jgi:hypothetical protein
MKASILIIAIVLTGCATTSRYDPQRQYNSLRLLEIGSQLMINSGPRQVYAPQLYAPQHSICVEYGYGITSCQQW